MIQEYEKPVKLLTILSEGRNDKYGGHFLWSLATVINRHARNISILGVEKEVELLVTDWGSEEPLYKVLDLTEEARQLVRFVLVPPEIAKIYDSDATFSVPHSFNTIARRAMGKYLILCDADIYAPLESMAKLIYYLRNGYINQYSLDEAFFWASRYLVPYELAKTRPSLDELDNHIENFWTTYEHQYINKVRFFGVGIALLMKRDIWYESTGFDEKLIYWGWNDIDWTTRLSKKYSWDDLELYGMKFFHIEHLTSGGYRKHNIPAEPLKINPNPENWGLKDYTFDIIDGYGLKVDPYSRESVSKSLVSFHMEKDMQNVREICASNPLYQNVEKNISPKFIIPSNSENLGRLISYMKPRRICVLGERTGSNSCFFSSFPFVEEVVVIEPWNINTINPLPSEKSRWYFGNNSYEQFLSNCIYKGVPSKIYPLRLDAKKGAEYLSKRTVSFDLIYMDREIISLNLKRDLLMYYGLCNVICGSNWKIYNEVYKVPEAIDGFIRDKHWKGFYENDFWILINNKEIELLNNIRSLIKLNNCDYYFRKNEEYSKSAVKRFLYRLRVNYNYILTLHRKNVTFRSEMLKKTLYSIGKDIYNHKKQINIIKKFIVYNVKFILKSFF